MKLEFPILSCLLCGDEFVYSYYKTLRGGIAEAIDSGWSEIVGDSNISIPVEHYHMICPVCKKIEQDVLGVKNV